MFLPQPIAFWMALGGTRTTYKSGGNHVLLLNGNSGLSNILRRSRQLLSLSQAIHDDGDDSTRKSATCLREPPSKAELEILQLAQSHFLAQALLATTRIGALDVLEFSDDNGATALTVDRIISEIRHLDADAVSINRDALFRCLRLLCSSGVILEVINNANESAFLLTETGRLLQRHKDNYCERPSISSFVLHWCESPLWNAWSYLPDYVAGRCNLKKSESFDSMSTPFDRANGMSASEYYKEHASSCSHRNAVARYASSKEIKSIMDAMKSSSVLNESILVGKTIVDVGGGYGDLVQAMKVSMPSIGDCYCLDLPDVIADALSTTTIKSYSDNLVSGNMFDSSTIPNCDYIIMKHVLCDFSDEDVVRALKAFHAVLLSSTKDVGGSGKVVIMDAVLPNGNDLNGKWNAALSYDVLLLLSGRRGERSRVEWSNLAKRAGFVLEDVVSTSSVTVDLAILSLA